MNLLDVLIVGFILFGALHGYRRGLITSIVNFLGWIIGFLVASWQYLNALRWIEQYFSLQQWLEPVIYRALLPSVESKASALQQQVLGNIWALLPDEWRNSLPSLNITGTEMPQTIEQMTHQIAATITDSILCLIAFGLVYFAVVLFIQLLVSLFLRPFGGWNGSFNRGGGLVLGGVSSLIGLSVLAGILSPWVQFGLNASFKELVQNSTLYPYLVHTFNVLNQLLSAQLREKLMDPLSHGKGIWF